MLNYVVIILNTLVGLLYTPYMLRMMGQNEYGLYSLVASVISYLTILDLGFGNAIVRYTAKFRVEGKVKEQYEMFGMFFILYIVIGLLAFGAGLGLYFNVDNMFGTTMTLDELNKARTMMLLLMFNLAFTFPMSIFGSIINAYEHFVFPRILNIARVILNTAVMILLLSIGYKAVAMVLVQTVFNILTLVLNYIYCKYRLQIKLIFGKFNWGFIKEVAIYSFWIFLNVIMDKIYWSTGQFVLGAFVGTAAVAIFAIAIQFQGMYMMFSSAISTVFLPKVTGMVALKNDIKEISDLFIRTGRIQFIIIGYILTGFILFGKQFIILWAGEEYVDVFPITLMFFSVLLVPLIQNLGITILQARNQMKFRSVLYVVLAACALVLQIAFAKLWGGIGCAIAISLSLFIGQGVIMNVYYSAKQNIDIPKFWKEIAKMCIVPIIICAICIYALKYYIISTWGQLAAAVIIFSLVYIPLFIMFSMNAYERELIFNPIIKRIRK